MARYCLDFMCLHTSKFEFIKPKIISALFIRKSQILEMIALSNKRYGYILISDRKWWNRLCKRHEYNDRNYVFVRRNRVGPCEAHKLFFYVKKPVMQIRGVADFVERLTGNHKELWKAYGHETCLKTFNEYTNFLQGRQIATFIRFTDLNEFMNPIPARIMYRILGTSRVPRGGKYLNRETVNQLTVGRRSQVGKVQPKGFR